MELLKKEKIQVHRNNSWYANTCTEDLSILDLNIIMSCECYLYQSKNNWWTF